LPDYFAMAMQRIFALATGCAGKEIGELTDQERVALGIAAGCEYESALDGLRLKNPVGFAKIDGRFTVYEQRR
jgi:hypothetical protein